MRLGSSQRRNAENAKIITDSVDSLTDSKAASMPNEVLAAVDNVEFKDGGSSTSIPMPEHHEEVPETLPPIQIKVKPQVVEIPVKTVTLSNKFEDRTAEMPVEASVAVEPPRPIPPPAVTPDEIPKSSSLAITSPEAAMSVSIASLSLASSKSAAPSLKPPSSAAPTPLKVPSSVKSEMDISLQPSESLSLANTIPHLPSDPLPSGFTLSGIFEELSFSASGPLPYRPMNLQPSSSLRLNILAQASLAPNVMPMPSFRFVYCLRLAFDNGIKRVME